MLLVLPAMLLASPAWSQVSAAKPESLMLDDACTPQSASTYNPQTDWAWLCRYHAANLALPGGRADIVFIGDSITEGWGHFQPALFTGGIVNRGISGQTSPQLLVRFMADVVALKPRVVHLMIGTNDIAGNTGPTTPEAWKNNVRAMVELARVHDIRVILGSIPPADHMLIVRNDDRPGMIGLVGQTLGQAGVNIADMHLGRSADGSAALMVLATGAAVPDEVVASLRAAPGIDSVHAVNRPGA